MSREGAAWHARGGLESDEELMARYAAGDLAAAKALFDRHAPRIYRLLRRQVEGEEDARDLTQQTFLQLHRARRDFRPGAALRPWLLTIALNLRRQHFRGASRRKETPSEVPEAAVVSQREAELDAADAGETVRAAVAALPEGQREVVELHWFEGLSFPEVAHVLGVSLTAVKVRAHRAYATLRARLGDLGRSRAGGSGI